MVKKIHNARPLTDSEKEKLRNVLLAKRAEIIGNVGSMENSSLNDNSQDQSRCPTHMADISSDGIEKEYIMGMMQSEKNILFEIEEALSRLDRGTYGICQGNGEYIPKARLKAIPWSRYCVSCANQMEKFNRGNHKPRNKYEFASGIDDVDYNDFDTSSSEYRNILKNEMG